MAIQRNPDGSYTVLRDSGVFYTVQTVSGKARSCNCARFSFTREVCKHMRAVEEFAQQGEPPEQPFLDAPLNGNGGFSLLR